MTEVKTTGEIINKTTSRFARIVEVDIDKKWIPLEVHKAKVEEIFKRFDKYACIRDDKWYKELKAEVFK